MINFEDIPLIAPEVQKEMFTAVAMNLGEGSLLGAEAVLKEREVIARVLGVNAAERVVALNGELLDEDPEGVVFAGGVCALSTRESRLLGLEASTEDPVTGQKLAMETEADLEGLSDAVSAVQIFETVGQTPNTTAIVLEDALWTEKVTDKLSTVGIEPVKLAAKAMVEARNRRALAGLNGLRRYLFGSQVANTKVIFDTNLLDQLTEKTDKMIADLGLPPNNDPYRIVYAGMYSYVWRNLLIEAGLLDRDQTMVIYEPSKHIGREGAAGSDISRFKSALRSQAPFMQPGSPNEKLGVLTYLEPRDPNGRRFRDSVPLSLMPNSKNYQDFDFSKFPIVPKIKDNQLAEYSDFTFVDDLGDTTLLRNPAFLWGLVYPVSERALRLMQQMYVVNKTCKQFTKDAVKQAEPAEDRQRLVSGVRARFSTEMYELSEQLVQELGKMNQAMFGGNI